MAHRRDIMRAESSLSMSQEDRGTPAESVTAPTLTGRDRTAELSGVLTLEELSDRHMRFVLELCHGNKSAAARVLGISVRSVYRWLDRQGVAA